MEINRVKAYMNNTFYYDTGQVNFDGCTIKKFLLTGCILRRDKRKHFYYQAELKEINKKAVIIVPLEKVLTKIDI